MSQTCILGARADTGQIGSFVADNDDVGTPEQIADGVFFLRGGTHYFRDGTQTGPAGSVPRLMCNNGWVVLGDHVLLIDANMPGRADILIEAVRATTDKPIRFVFNTHHHGDHVYGNRAIVERTGATIIASTKMVEELRRYETGAFGGPPGRWEQVAKARSDVAATSLLVPTTTFERAMELTGSQGRRVELLHLGMGHTRGDAIAWLPSERIMFVGDLVANGPFNIVRDAEMAPWIDTLTAMQALDPLVVCPGHGALGDGALLAHQRAFFIALAAETAKHIRAGRTREDIPGCLADIRSSLLSNPDAAGHVIPASADLSVLSLQAQVERAFDQMIAPKEPVPA